MMRWISGEITSANPGLHFILGLAVHILTIAKVVACLLKLSIHIEVFLLLDYLALSGVFPCIVIIHSSILASLTVKRVVVYATLLLLVLLRVHARSKLTGGKCVLCLLVEA